VGLSLGLFYPHGRAASVEELVRAAAIVSAYDRCLSVHIRDERDGLAEAIVEVIEIAAQTGVRLQVSHLKAMGSDNWGSIMTSALDPLAEASEGRSLDIGVDVYPYTYGATSLSSVLPAWISEGGSAELLCRIADPAARARAGDQIGQDRGRFKLEEIVLSSLSPAQPDLEGLPLLQAAQEKQRDPAELLIDLVEQSSDTATMLVRSMDAGDMEEVIKSPLSVVGSDGWETSPRAGSHPRNFETFPYFIGEFVRRRNLLTLEEAIAKCTSKTADRFRVGRGRLHEGAVADVVAFDPSTIDGRRSATSSPEQPIGVLGVEMVFVGGRLENEASEIGETAAGLFLNSHGART
jgi:N-acyl-D-amino-acid deacylase